MISCASTGGLGYLFSTGDGSDSGAQAIRGLPAPIATTPIVAASAVGPTVAVITVPLGVAPATAPLIALPADTAAAPSASVVAVDPASTPVAPVAAPPVAAVARSGAFDGAIVNTRYGPVEVQVQITNGRLAEVAVVEYPNGDRKSRRISAAALPTLRTEALSAQSARVDTVSGATYTSDGYTRSLQSALDTARRAGVAVKA